MSEPRKKPGVGFWTTVVVVVMLLYAASIGPWFRFNRAGPGTVKAASVYVWPYYPLLWLFDNGPPPVKSAIRTYVWWWLA